MNELSQHIRALHLPVKSTYIHEVDPCPHPDSVADNVARIVVNLKGHLDCDDILRRLRERGFVGFLELYHSPPVIKRKITQIVWWQGGRADYDKVRLHVSNALVSE